MLRRSITVLSAALKLSFSPLRKESMINAFLMALSITTAILIAASLHLPAPYWAGISAMMVVMPTLRDTTRKGLMRLFGTYLGALIGWSVVRLGVGHIPSLFFCLLFVSIVVPLLWMQNSRYPYAVLIGGITCDMVMLAGLVDPAHTQDYATARCIEISIGTVTSLVLYSVAMLAGKLSYQVEIKERRKKTLHALAGSQARTALAGGLAGCAAVGLWLHFHFNGIEQSVTSVWVLSFGGTAFDTYHKGLQRFSGCVVGGSLAALLHLIPASFPIFLCLIFCFCLLCGIIQNGPLQGRYFGLQAAFAFLIVYANTEGAELAVFRLLSIVDGLALVVLFSVIIARLTRNPGRIGGQSR
jgi:uncharacterized membrane protein YccC